MRTDISLNRFSWLYGLDYKKLIIIVFLLRLITASAYDIFVAASNKDILLPDSNFYSIKGRYVNLVIEGYGKSSMTKDLISSDQASQGILGGELFLNNGNFPRLINESNIFGYIIGFIYTVFGYSTIWVRVFNIFLSMASVYLLFNVAKRYFGDLTANLFLIVALFLPTQFMYSITLSRDFLRVFIVSVIIWAAYTIGDIWTRRLKPQF